MKHLNIEDIVFYGLCFICGSLFVMLIVLLFSGEWMAALWTLVIFWACFAVTFNFLGEIEEYRDAWRQDDDD